MDRRTMRYGSTRSRHASSVVVLDFDDVELAEETHRRVVTRSSRARARSLPTHDRYPPAISDRELRRLVDECTEEICLLEYRGYDRTARRRFR